MPVVKEVKTMTAMDPEPMKQSCFSTSRKRKGRRNSPTRAQKRKQPMRPKSPAVSMAR